MIMKTESLRGAHWGSLDKKKAGWNKKIWIALLMLVIVAAAGFGAFRVYTQGQATVTTTTAKVQTAVARTGELTIYASGAGKVVSSAKINLSFDESGTVSEVLVKVGEEVKAVQTLARLQTNNTTASITASISSGELSVLNAQQKLDTLSSSASTASAQALKNLEDAQTALTDLGDLTLKVAVATQGVADAQQTLDTAQQAYDNAHSTGSKATIDSYYAAMLAAKQNLEKAQENYNNNLYRKADDIIRARATSQLSTAHQNYNYAVWNYNAAQGTANKTERSVTEANLAAAKVKLNDAQSGLVLAMKGPTPGEIALAKAKVDAAQAEWNRLKDGLDPRDVAIAQATLDNARAQLELAKAKKLVIDLVAPTQGTILSIAVNAGEAAGTSTFITMADLKKPRVQIYLDETDLGKVSVGLEADVVFDALPDQTFVGHVVEVNPSLVVTQNVSTVSALVELESGALTDNQTLAIGMNASVDVISGRARNAVLVPVEALRSIGTDEYAVFVMENGTPKLRTVTVGLQDVTSAEILTGLKSGEVVTTGVVATVATR
jgi:HlyD family secretion protein